METKKKKKPTALILVLLCLLVVGGYIYYSAVYVPEKEGELYKFEDTKEEITTEVICGEVHGWDWEAASTQARCMENSPAKFFIGDANNEVRQFYTISQTDKETYESTVARPPIEASTNFYKNMSHFFNLNYSEMPSKHECYWGVSDMGKNTMLGDQWPRVLNTDTIDDFFGTDIYDYFQNHKLVLSCDTIELTKLCGGNIGKDFVAGIEATKWYHTVDYVYVGYAEVKTESAEGDLSDMDIFGDPGETVKVRIVATGEDSGLKKFHLERVQ